MSIEALRWARRQNCPDPTMKLILMLLADAAGPVETDLDEAPEIGPDHATWISIPTLARESGLQERGLQKQLAKMIDLGLIRRILRFRANGSQRSSYIVVNISQDSQDTPPVSSSAPGTVSPRTPLEPPVKNPQVVQELYPPQPAPPSEAPRGTNRATRLPENFTPTDAMKDWVRINAPNVDGWAEHEKFMDHFLSTAGPNSRKVDWVRAWRNWMRRANEQRYRRPQVQQFKTAHEKRQDAMRATEDLIERAELLVVQRGGSVDDNAAVWAAMQELKEGRARGRMEPGMTEPYIEGEVVQLELMP